MKVTLTEFVFPVNGGERTVAHDLVADPQAYGSTWDAETLTLNYYTPAVDEDSEPEQHSVVVTQEQIDAAIVELETPQSPAPKQSWTPLEFLARFTEAEQAAIVNSTDTQVKIVYGMLLAASEIVHDDPRTVQGLAVLVSEGIITQERSDEISSGL